MFERRRAPIAVDTARRGAWPLSVGLFLEVLACCIAVIGLVQGRNWWLALIGTAALLLAVPLALRFVGVPSWAASLIDLAVFGGVLQLFYGLGTMPRLVGKAMAEVNSQGVPASPLPALIFLFVLFGGAMAFLLDLIAVTIRMPALTALVIGGVLVVPAVLQPSGLSLIALAGAAGTWFVVLWAGGVVRLGSRGGGPLALAVGASATLLAVTVAATAPGFGDVWRSDSTAGALSVSASVNPLIDLSKNLRQPVPMPVLQYTTTDPQPDYLQLTTLDSFNGTVWQHRNSAKTAVPDDGSLGSPQGLPPTGVATAAYSTTIKILGLASPWVPVPPATVKLQQDDRVAATFEPVDHTLNAASENLAADRYATTSLNVTDTFEQIEAIEASAPADHLPANVQRDLYLPKSVPKIITQTAATAVQQAGATTPFQDAVALQNYFQNSLNGFSYSTTTPDSVDGTSLQVVAKFLQEKTGYCIHFATAMAVMARVLGIPSRIAMGYLPGTFEQQEVAGGFAYQVDSSDLHAWPQLYFPGVGWLNFEPTVSRGAAPQYTIPSVASGPDSPAAPVAPVTPAAAPASTPSAAPVAQSKSPAATQVITGGSAGGAVALLVVVAALLAPFATRRARRRWRVTRLRDEGRPARLAWDEVRDTARDLGLASSTAETPRAFASRLRESWPTDAALRADLDELLDVLERAEYGPGVEGRRYELAETTTRIARGLARVRPALTRLRAALLPVSLLQRRSNEADRLADTAA